MTSLPGLAIILKLVLDRQRNITTDKFVPNDGTRNVRRE